MPHEAPLPPDIKLIDTLHIGRRQEIGAYLLLGDEPAVVDPGPASALPGLEAGLAAHGLRVEDLRALLLTHIHLDHAGATGTLVRRNPRLRVFVHARGAPHMIDPERLLRSATRLYGDQMEYLWGEFLPTPAENVTALAEAAPAATPIPLGARLLHAYDAPGHASHHVIFHEPASGMLWVGDDAGIRMPGFSYPRPATPPPDVDLEGWERTFEAMLALRPRALLLTHFGPAFDPEAHIARLRRHMAEWSALVRAGLASGAPEAEQVAALRALAARDLGDDASEATLALYEQAASVEQCWQGLARYWRKRADA